MPARFHPSFRSGSRQLVGKGIELELEARESVVEVAGGKGMDNRWEGKEKIRERGEDMPLSQSSDASTTLGHDEEKQWKPWKGEQKGTI